MLNCGDLIECRLNFGAQSRLEVSTAALNTQQGYSMLTPRPYREPLPVLYQGGEQVTTDLANAIIEVQRKDSGR